MVDYFQCIEMAVFDSTTLTGTFEPMNGSANQPTHSAVGFQFAILVMQIYNDGTTGVTISFDGETPNLYVPSKGTLVIDLQTNHPNSSNAAGTKIGRKGQLVYGKGTASASGNIYISGYF